MHDIGRKAGMPKIGSLLHWQKSWGSKKGFVENKQSLLDFSTKMGEPDTLQQRMVMINCI